MSDEARDIDLAFRAQAGDMAALEALYRKHHDSAVRIAYGVTRSPTKAEDAAAEVWLWCLERRWRLDPEATRADGDLTGFIKTLAYFAAIKATYRSTVDRHTVDNLTSEGEPDNNLLTRLHSTFPDPEAQLLRAELRRRLCGALDALPDHLRHVAYLRYVSELSGPDIAAIVGVQANTIPGYFDLIRKRLRVALEGVCTLPPPGRYGHVRYERGSTLRNPRTTAQKNYNVKRRRERAQRRAEATT
jgi:RNA polymerase sigma-70 factor (ECF subfamily)